MSDPACADPLNAGEFGQLALRCGASVAPSTLASIARTDSGFRPLSINDNTTGNSGISATCELPEAAHSVDVGIMQINSSNFARLRLTLESAFGPCRSIAAASVNLAGNYDGGDTHVGQRAAFQVAISKYDTGYAQRGFPNGYVHKVELAAWHIVPTLDVSAAPAAIDSQPEPAATPALPVGPKRPQRERGVLLFNVSALIANLSTAEQARYKLFSARHLPDYLGTFCLITNHRRNRRDLIGALCRTGINSSRVTRRTVAA